MPLGAVATLGERLAARLERQPRAVSDSRTKDDANVTGPCGVALGHGLQEGEQNDQRAERERDEPSGMFAGRATPNARAPTQSRIATVSNPRSTPQKPCHALCPAETTVTPDTRTETLCQLRNVSINSNTPAPKMSFLPSERSFNCSINVLSLARRHSTIPTLDSEPGSGDLLLLNKLGQGKLHRSPLMRGGIPLRASCKDSHAVASSPGGAALLLARRSGLSAPGLLDVAEAAEGGNVQRFVSRPDLKPPTLTVLQPAHGTAPGLVFMAPSSGPGQRGAMIFDDAGELVWFRPVLDKTVTDFKVGLFHGKPVLTWWEGKAVHGLADGEWVVLDTSYRELFRFSAARGLHGDLHEFVITPQNTALVTSNETKTWDLTSVGGSRRGQVVGGVVQELALPSGRLLWEWRSLDHVAVDETEIKAAARAALRLLPHQLDRRRSRQ